MHFGEFICGTGVDEMRIEWIVLHHTLTKDGKTVSWQAIRDYHVNHNGWRDIGYHFGMERVNNRYEILVGRPIGEIGAHTRGLNNNSIGIAIVGNFDEKPINSHQLHLLLRFIHSLAKVFSIPAERVIGHREAFVLVEKGYISEYYRKHNRKSCPGWRFSMNVVRQSLIDMGIPVHDTDLLERLSRFDRKTLSERRVWW